MARRGPKGNTDAQKRARGTAQKCRLGSNVIDVFDVIETKDQLPEPPDWFFEFQTHWSPSRYQVAYDTFIKNRDRLFKNGRLREQHIDGLTNLAVLQGDFFEKAKSGNIPASLVAQITSLQKSLGVLPDGKETSASLEPPKQNRFTQNENKHGARR